MKRQFIRNLVLVIAINLLIKPFWILVVERGVQNAVGSENYGLYFALFNFAFLLNVVLDFGINNYNITSLSQNPDYFSHQFSRILPLKLLLTIAYFIITLIIGFFYQYNGMEMKILVVLCLNQVLSFMISYFRSNLSGLHLYATDSILSTLDRLLMIILVGSLLWGNFAGPFQIEWFIYSQTASYFLTALICFFVVKSHLVFLRFEWNPEMMKTILAKSLPFAILGILMSIYMKIDAVLIERMLADGKEQAGQYASAYRLLDAANMIAVLFAGLLLPMFSRLISNGEKVTDLAKVSGVLIFIPAFVLAVCCYNFRTEIMHLLSKHYVDSSAEVFGFLMFSFIPICLVYIFGTLLTAGKHLFQLNIIAGAGCVINILVIIIFIRSNQLMAAVWAALLTQTFVAVSHIILSTKYYAFNFNVKLVLKLFAYCILFILIVMYSNSFGLEFRLQLVVLAIIALVLVFVLRIIRLGELRRQIQVK